MKKIFKSSAIGSVLIFGFALFVLSNHIGGFRAFTVMSGSMEPAINTGSLVIAKRIFPSELKVNDIITFVRPSKNREYITHRVAQVSGSKQLTILKTKGDHNSSSDPWVLAGGAVVGKVELTVPYLGYLLSFGKTKAGIAFLILFPAFIIIYLEISNILKLLKANKSREIAIQGQLLLFIFVITALVSVPLEPTSALLSDTASLTGNNFTVISEQNNTGCSNGTNIDISGNGAGSNNNVNVYSKCNTIVNQSNSTNISNTIHSNSSSSTSEIINNVHTQTNIETSNINATTTSTNIHESNKQEGGE